MEDIHLKRYKIEPGQSVRLNDWDPGDTSGFDGTRQEAEIASGKLIQRLERLQNLLYAEHKHKLLLILQAMDTGGKDGTIRHVFEGVDPQGVSVAHFREPTPEELDHDFLWRVHKLVPGKGEIGIFNRSHYEGVLVERVHGIVPERVWQRRYAEINDFERLLSEDGTTILKFYLHIDADEQKKRLQDRLDDPTEQWKFNVNDLPERRLWSEYLEAYRDTLEKTSTKYAPWYLIPANHKWYRNLLVSTIIVKTLEDLKMRYPRIKNCESIKIV